MAQTSSDQVTAHTPQASVSLTRQVHTPPGRLSAWRALEPGGREPPLRGLGQEPSLSELVRLAFKQA